MGVIAGDTGRWMLAELGVLLALLFNPWLLRRVLGLDPLGELPFYTIVLLEVVVAVGSLALVVRKRWWLRMAQGLGGAWLLLGSYATWVAPPLQPDLSDRKERLFRYEILREYATIQRTGIVTRGGVTASPWLEGDSEVRTMDLAVPPDGVLDTAIGVHPAISRLVEGEVEFAIEAITGEASVELLRESRRVGPGAGDDAFAWRHVSVDLGPFAGRRVVLRFVSSYGDAARQDRKAFDVIPADFMLWGAPSVRPRATGGKNVLLVSLDTLRADHLHSMGYSRETSPRIDELARTGVTFESCFSQAPWTTPSHLSILTGTYPSTHGASEPYQVRSSPWRVRLPTLATLLKRAGYATAAFVGSGNMSAGFGLHEGFDVYDETELDAGGSDIDTVTEKAVRWIEAHNDRSFFLFVHSFEPHTPYSDRHFLEAEGLEEAAESVREIALYDGDVRQADRGVGRLLDALRAASLLENTIVVVTSDHGEELDEGEGRSTVGWNYRHGHTLYDELMHVPLVIHGLVGAEPGSRVAAQVRAIDLLPTLLDYLAVDVPEHVEGASLRPLIEGRSQESRPAFFEATTMGTERDGVRADSFKYVRRLSYGMLPESEGAELTPLRELYDLEADPLERNNVAETYPERAARLERLIAELVPGKPDGGQRRSAGRDREPLDPRVQEALRVLGYVE